MTILEKCAASSTKLHDRPCRLYLRASSMLLLMLAAGVSHAADWQQLGPSGGPIWSVAAGPSSIYALAGAERPRLYRSDDGGARWTEHALPTTFIGPLQARSDGHVFLHSTGEIYRSKDGGESWSLYGPENHDGALLFDPFVAARAVVVGGSQETIYVDVTQDDGVTWTYQFADYGAYNPGAVVYDPRQAGRLVGVGNNFKAIPTVNTAPLKAYESLDQGRRWREIATLHTPGTLEGTCYPGPLRADGSGRLYVAAPCGLFRSDDRGSHWERVLAFPTARFFILEVDPLVAGHLVLMASSFDEATLMESRDAGASWTQMPRPEGHVAELAFSRDGKLWMATSNGVARYDALAKAWTLLVNGINNHPLSVLVPAAGAGGTVVLTGLETLSGQRAGDVQSTDGGATWRALDIAGEDADELVRNASVASSLMALTTSQHVYASVDGGGSWALMTTNPSLGAGEILQGVVPAGPQPGLVYGLYATCVSNGFGCSYQPQGVSRSTDGGRTWAHATTGIAGQSFIVTPSASNPNIAMSVVADGRVYVTQNAGLNWLATAPVSAARLTSDPLDASHWYAFGFGSVAYRTGDLGATWVPLGDRLLASSDQNLLADPHVPGRVYAVGIAGDVSISNDRGASWQRIVEPSATLRLASHSMRIGPEPSTTVYAAAAQGADKLVMSPSPEPAKARVVEFYHQRLDHYFMTSDPAEMALMDSDHFHGWSRTGATFDALPPATSPVGGASPVCRFYGKPEKGLDTHFYSASAVECQQVGDRFPDAWIFESAAVFAVYLPAIDGSCPPATVPLYRVYNNRRDANHRYSTSVATRDGMVARGWIAEGYGADAVAMCVL